MSKNKNGEVPFDDLVRATKIAAKVVALYGDVYLPIFKRMHTELENAKQKETEKEKWMQLVNSYLPDEEKNSPR